MSEKKGAYEVEDNAENALEMLGVGYDQNQPAVIIQQKQRGLALFDSGLEEYSVWGWVKISANFINHIQRLSGANIKCWLTIALAIDETGVCKLKIKELQKLTKLSHTEVISSTKELEEMGYLQVKRNARGNQYEPIFAARGVGNDPENSVVKKVDSTLVDQVESTPQIEKLHASIKELKELNIYTDEFFRNLSPLDAHKVPTIKLYHLATNFFPGTLTYKYIHDFIIKNELTYEKINSAAVAWKIQGFKIENVKGLLEWARDGVPANNRKPTPIKPNGKYDGLMKYMEKNNVK